MKLEPFKMEVNMLQSRILQKYLLSLGYTWNDGSKEVFTGINHKYLFFDGKKISMGNNTTDFIFDQFPEIKFNLFESKYILE